MKYIILEKVNDLRFGGFRPNWVYVGDRLRGFIKNEPIIGQQLYLYDRFNRVVSWTSKVVNFNSTELKTENSIFKIYNVQYCEDCTETFNESIVVNEEHCCPICLNHNIKAYEY